MDASYLVYAGYGLGGLLLFQVLVYVTSKVWTYGSMKGREMFRRHQGEARDGKS